MDRFDCFYRNDFGDEYTAFSRRARDGDWYDAHDVDTEIARLIDELDGWEASSKAWEGKAARLTRERDEAVKAAVWAAQHGANVGWDGNSDPCIWYAGGDGYQTLNGAFVTLINYNGTEADIYRALREAMGASEGGGDGAI